MSQSLLTTEAGKELGVLGIHSALLTRVRAHLSLLDQSRGSGLERPESRCWGELGTHPLVR